MFHLQTGRPGSGQVPLPGLRQDILHGGRHAGAHGEGDGGRRSPYLRHDRVHALASHQAATACSQEVHALYTGILMFVFKIDGTVHIYDYIRHFKDRTFNAFDLNQKNMTVLKCPGAPFYCGFPKYVSHLLRFLIVSDQGNTYSNFTCILLIFTVITFYTLSLICS